MDIEEKVESLDRALRCCATGATVHQLANAQFVLKLAWGCYMSEQSKDSRRYLEEAIRAGRDILVAGLFRWPR